MPIAAPAALAVVFGIGAVLAWSGRWRRWTRHALTADGGLVLGGFPVVAVMFAFAALGGAGVVPRGLAGAAGLLGGVAVIAFAWSAPSWLGPAWFRERPPPTPDVGEPVTAAIVAAGSPAPRPSPAQAAAAHFDGEPLGRWNAVWIEGDEWAADDTAPYGRPGVVNGKLALYPDGVSFRASPMEERVRGHVVAVTFRTGELRAVRVVPAGAGADGVRRRTGHARSVFTRLVLESDDGAYLFEVQSARRRARQIADALGAGSEGV